jgi:hypothetical protein
MPLTRRTFLTAMPLPGLVAIQGEKPRLRRPESFFGLHFDLHPNPSDPALGRDVTEEMVEKLLAAARPDFVQYDSKGHAGWLGWPSKVGPPAPHIVKDSLEIWRRVTARRGVALYIHFSGVWDGQAVERHPDWARLDAQGKPDGRNTSTFGPYVDELMIPELREAASKYDLDGAWVDGECWSVQIDYSSRALEAWRKATGFAEAPKNAQERHWLEWLEFNREQFRRYVKHYVDALHQSHPKFQIASNWLYSTFVPEEPALPVDFLSGDYLGNAAISAARLESRYMGQTGEPWDLMAWGFQTTQPGLIGHVHKPAVQLQQEASVVLAQGGGFQIYYTPSREGHFEDSTIAVMGKVGAFCRARQAFCHRSETVPQVGVVFSRESLYATSNKLFGGWGRASAPASGWLDALIQSQYSADIVPDWKLEKIGARYALLVLPDWPAAGEKTLAALRAYAERGGVLVASGAANAGWFLYASVQPKEQPAFVGGSEVLASMGGLWLDVAPGSGLTVIEKRYPTMDTTLNGQPAAVSMKADRGEIVIVPGPVGALYAGTHAPAVRDFMRRLVAPRFTPLVTVEGPPTIEVVLRRKSGKLYVHLLNLTAMQEASEYAAIDFVPEVGPVRVTFHGRPPKSVRLLPEGGRVLEAPYVVERLHIHAALEVV